MARFDGSIDQEETQGAVHRHQLKTGTAGLQVRQEPDPRARIPKEQEAGVRPHVGVVVLYRHRGPSAEFLDGEVYRIRVQVAQSGGPVSQIDEAGSELGRRIVTQLKKHMRTGDDERLPTGRRRFEEVERVLETGQRVTLFQRRLDAIFDHEPGKQNSSEGKSNRGPPVQDEVCAPRNDQGETEY